MKQYFCALGLLVSSAASSWAAFYNVDYSFSHFDGTTTGTIKGWVEVDQGEYTLNPTGMNPFKSMGLTLTVQDSTVQLRHFEQVYASGMRGSSLQMTKSLCSEPYRMGQLCRSKAQLFSS